MKKRILFIALFFHLALGGLANAFGPNNLMCWQAPTGNTDGSNLFSGPTGYKVYLGTQPGAYTQVFDVGAKPGAVCNAGETGIPFSAIGTIADGQYFAAITAYNAGAAESAFSNEVSFSFATTTTTTTPTTVKTTTTTSTVKATTTTTATTIKPTTTTTTTIRPSIPNAPANLIVR